jgi:hypothetical protein
MRTIARFARCSLSIGHKLSGVSFQRASSTDRKLEAYATMNTTVIVRPMLIRVALLDQIHELVAQLIQVFGQLVSFASCIESLAGFGIDSCH